MLRRRHLLQLLLPVLLLLCTPGAARASDGVVTYSSGGTSHISDEAAQWLEEYGDEVYDRWKNGGSKLYPPESWPSPGSVAQTTAKKDAGAFAKKLALTASKGAMRAVPWIAVGLTAYQLCDLVHEGCWIFGRDEPALPPGCESTMEGTYTLCRQVSDTPHVFETDFMGIPAGAYWLVTKDGTGTPSLNVRDCDAFSFPVLASELEAFPSATPCGDGSPSIPRRIEIMGWPADFDQVLPLDSGAANTLTTTVSDRLDDATLDELAEWLDRPENHRTRTHIASEIDEDVPDPYVDGVRVPSPRSTETYDQYTDRLRAAGLLGTLRFANEYHPAPAGTKPGRVFEVSPDPGTKVGVGSVVTYRAAPMDGSSTEPSDDTATGPGSSPDNPSHTQVGTPPASGTYTCPATIPTPNLTPLAISFTDKWPFGFIGWFGEVMADINGTGAAPVVTMPEIAGKTWTLDLGDFNEEAAVARTALGWMGSLFIVAWITQVALNRRITNETD